MRQLHELAGAFRHLGYEAETALNSVNPFYSELTYDYLLNDSLSFPHSIASSTNPLVRYPRGFADRTYRLIKRLKFPDFLNDYDVYIFQFGESLLPGNKDFPILKARGKKIVSIFQGSDIRHWSATEPVREAFGVKAYQYYREGAGLNDALKRLRMAERYADVIFLQPSYGELAVRPYMHLYLALNLEIYPHRIPARDIPHVVHAPSKRQLKGTAEILEAVGRLKDEGAKFTFELIEGRPNHEVINRLADADVLIDELNESHYGMLSLEAMATGCAVAGGNLPAFVPIPSDRPVLHLNPANLFQQLRRLVTDKSVRLEMAAAGRPFVAKYHERCKVAQHVLDCLDQPQNVRHDYYPSYFAGYYRPPQGHLIPSELQRLTAEVIQRYGLPEGVSSRGMIERGSLSANGLSESQPVLVWKPNTNGHPDKRAQP